MGINNTLPLEDFSFKQIFNLLGSNRKDLPKECVGLGTGCKLYDPNYFVYFIGPCIICNIFKNIKHDLVIPHVYPQEWSHPLLFSPFYTAFEFLFKNRIENNLPSYKFTTGPKIMKLS